MWKKAACVFAVVALLLVANGLLTTGLPLRWSHAGIASHAIARLAACAYGGVLLGGLFAASLVRRMGCRASFLVFTACFAGGNALFLLPGPVGFYGAVRLLTGSAIAGLYLLIESRLNVIATPESRARILSAYMVVFYLAQACGSSLASVLPANGPQALVVAVTLIVLAGFGLRSFPSESAAVRIPRRAGAWSLLRSSPEGYAGGFAAGVLLGTFYGLAPVFAATSLSSSALAGPFMAATMLGGVLGLLAMSKLAGFLTSTASTAASCLATGALALAMIGARSAGDEVLIAVAAVFGAVAFSLYPLASACVNARVAGAARVEANGLLILVTGSGGIVGPLLAGSLLAVVGTAAPFVVIASATMGAGLIIVLRIRSVTQRCAGRQHPAEAFHQPTHRQS